MATIQSPIKSSFSINYQKRKNINLFNKFQTNKIISLDQVQNYIPIYDRFFSLNETNYNSINLNHLWYVSDLKEDKANKNSKSSDNDFLSEHIYTCKLKNSNDTSGDFSSTQKVFIKMAPLQRYCKIEIVLHFNFLYFTS